MVRSGLLWILFLGGCLPTFGQYSLEEAGIQAGGGIVAPLGFPGLKSGTGFQFGAFYSHYACGKRYGFHGMLGFRNEKAAVPAGTPFPPYLPLKDSKAAFNYLEGGFFYKIRKNEYHRPMEAALLAGLKFSLAFNGRLRTGNTWLDLSSSSTEHFNRFNPAVHVSGWLKKKIGQQSLFFQPGIEFYPLAVYSSGSSGLSCLYGFLCLGYSLWNSHQRHVSKG